MKPNKNDFKQKPSLSTLHKCKLKKSSPKSTFIFKNQGVGQERKKTRERERDTALLTMTESVNRHMTEVTSGVMREKGIVDWVLGPLYYLFTHCVQHCSHDKHTGTNTSLHYLDKSVRG